MNDFNKIAWIYDSLAKWVYRGNILKSQIEFLPLIQNNQRILIIGGGTGQVLETMNALGIPLAIDFIEPSSEMMSMAKKRTKELSNFDVRFFQTEFESFHSNQRYDWICCFYFLDLFNENSLKVNLELISNYMGDDSLLIVSDFQYHEDSWWQNALSKVMHGFFKMVAQLESGELKDINESIIEAGYKKIKEAAFFSQFIFSAVYKKEVS